MSALSDVFVLSAAFQQQAQVQPILLQAPQQGITSQGVRYPLGVPFASYRSTVGAGLASWALGMMPVQDLVSLVVASVRDFRSLGPPTHCWQRPVVQQLLFDILVGWGHLLQLSGVCPCILRLIIVVVFPSFLSGVV